MFLPRQIRRGQRLLRLQCRIIPSIEVVTAKSQKRRKRPECARSFCWSWDLGGFREDAKSCRKSGNLSSASWQEEKLKMREDERNVVIEALILLVCSMALTPGLLTASADHQAPDGNRVLGVEELYRLDLLPKLRQTV